MCTEDGFADDSKERIDELLSGDPDDGFVRARWFHLFYHAFVEVFEDGTLDVSGECNEVARIGGSVVQLVDDFDAEFFGESEVVVGWQVRHGAWIS